MRFELSLNVALPRTLQWLLSCHLAQITHPNGYNVLATRWLDYRNDFRVRAVFPACVNNCSLSSTLLPDFARRAASVMLNVLVPALEWLKEASRSLTATATAAATAASTAAATAAAAAAAYIWG